MKNSDKFKIFVGTKQYEQVKNLPYILCWRIDTEMAKDTKGYVPLSVKKMAELGITTLMPEANKCGTYTLCIKPLPGKSIPPLKKEAKKKSAPKAPKEPVNKKPEKKDTEQKPATPETAKTEPEG